MAYVRPAPIARCHCGAVAVCEIANIRQSLRGAFCEQHKSAELAWLEIEEQILSKWCGEMIKHGAPLPEVVRNALDVHTDDSLTSMLRNRTIE